MLTFHLSLLEERLAERSIRGTCGEKSFLTFPLTLEFPDVPKVEDYESHQEKDTKRESYSKTSLLRTLVERSWLWFFLLSCLDWLGV